MNKRMLILIIVFFIPMLIINAQKTDEITLKTGSVIRGSVIEINSDEKVRINDAAGNTWVYSMDEIDHINKIEVPKSLNSDQYPEGWINMTSIGFLAGSNNSMQIAPFSLISSFGYKNSKDIYTGLATGIEFLNINHIPLLLDLQYFSGNKEVTPVVIVRGGYAIPSKTESGNSGDTKSYEGGITTSIGIGLKIRTKENFAWDINILYRHMQVKYSEYFEWSQQDYLYTDVYNRLELRLGFYLN